MNFDIEFDVETDGRWIADIPQYPGVMVYGDSKSDAKQKVEALLLRVLEEN